MESVIPDMELTLNLGAQTLVPINQKLKKIYVYAVCHQRFGSLMKTSME